MEEILKKIDEEIALNQAEADRCYKEEHYEQSRIYFNNVLTWKAAKGLIISQQKEPCEYCTTNYNKQQRLADVHGSGFTIEIDDGNLSVIYSEPWHGNSIYIPIKHCPMCGRLLNQPYTEQ